MYEVFWLAVFGVLLLIDDHMVCRRCAGSIFTGAAEFAVVASDYRLYRYFRGNAYIYPAGADKISEYKDDKNQC